MAEFFNTVFSDPVTGILFTLFGGTIVSLVQAAVDGKNRGNAIVGCIIFVSLLLGTLGVKWLSVQGEKDKAETLIRERQNVEKITASLDQTSRLIYASSGGKLKSSRDKSLTVNYFSENDQLRDFKAEAQFYVPAFGGVLTWNYGFVFRSKTLGADEYRLYVTQEKKWHLAFSKEGFIPGAPAIKILKEGKLDNLETSFDLRNRLTIYVRGGSAYFYVNDQYITVFDLTEKVETGNVGVATDFTPEMETESGIVNYTSFLISTLDN
jgi:hypothetical protein